MKSFDNFFVFFFFMQNFPLFFLFFFYATGRRSRFDKHDFNELQNFVREKVSKNNTIKTPFNVIRPHFIVFTAHLASV